MLNSQLWPPDRRFRTPITQHHCAKMSGKFAVEWSFSDRLLTPLAHNAGHLICAGNATMKLRLSIGRAVNLFGLVVTLGCIAILWTGVSALSELKVNGPIYRQIVLRKDLIADILAPAQQ